jgi:hypothetical protein
MGRFDLIRIDARLTHDATGCMGEFLHWLAAERAVAFAAACRGCAQQHRDSAGLVVEGVVDGVVVVSLLLSKPPVPLMSRSSPVLEPGTTSQVAREPVPSKVPHMRSTKVPDRPPTTPIIRCRLSISPLPSDPAMVRPLVALTLDVTVVAVDAAGGSQLRPLHGGVVRRLLPTLRLGGAGRFQLRGVVHGAKVSTAAGRRLEETRTRSAILAG